MGLADPVRGLEVTSDLVTHVVAGNSLFAGALRGGHAPAAPHVAFIPEAGLLNAYRDSAAELLGAFREPGALDRIVTVPFGTIPGVVALHLRITELQVHGWDLARATGQPATVPDNLAEQELAFTRSKLADIPPDRRPFGPPQPVAGPRAFYRPAGGLPRPRRHVPPADPRNRRLRPKAEEDREPRPPAQITWQAR